jgi:ribosomal protein L11 methylase PrmA
MQRIVRVLLTLALGTWYSQHVAAWIMWPPSPACATRQSEGVDVQAEAHPRALPWLPMSRVTNWVVENLESSSSRITSSSSVQAGENDTLPSLGLVIGQEGKQVRILPSGSSAVASSEVDTIPVVRLLLGRNGWGTGVHPTTRLCCEWICSAIQAGDAFLDYGTGSGILSVAALHHGARRIVGVDIEAEALVTAERNLQLNGYESDRYELLHTRQVVPSDPSIAPGVVDVCVANILIGQLVRPSMVAALVTNIRPGGMICLSGVRPTEVQALRSVYDPHVEWIDSEYAELSASETPGSVESYGFDCGRWARLVGRTRMGTVNIDALSELAVS